MKTPVLALVLICLYVGLCAQPNTVRVKAGDNMMEVLGREIYYYPAFQDGLIRYKPGRLQSSKFNFNMLNGEMQFVSAKGDTLSLADENTIDFIAIGADTFRYDKGYLQQLLTNGSVKVGVKRQIRILDVQKIGAYDQPSSTGAVSSYDTYSTGVSSFKLNLREDVLLGKQVYYFIGDRFNNFHPASRRAVYDLYPKKHSSLTTYFKQNSVDFNKEEDLQKLLSFLSQI